MDVAKTDEIKALLRKAEETRDCPSSGFYQHVTLFQGSRAACFLLSAMRPLHMSAL